MKIAFIGDSFHEKTGSSKFFKDILEEIGTTVDFYCADNTGVISDTDEVFSKVAFSGYDLVVCWQTEHFAARLLPFDLNIVLCPMWDAAKQRELSYWKKFRSFRFISFCQAQHLMLLREGCDSYYFQFYLNPEEFPNVERKKNVYQKAFFWERRPLESWSSRAVLPLCDNLSIEHLNVHSVPDYGETQEITWSKKITRTDWFETKADFLSEKRKYGVCFASRQFEGIGHSFLESLAMGQCLVSGDAETANEYITHGVNGILINRHSSLSFSAADIKTIGQNALELCKRGFETWHADTSRLKNLLLDKPARPKFRNRLDRATESAVIEEGRWLSEARCEEPLLTIITTIKDASADLKKTLGSIVSQTVSDDIEILIGDSQSTDEPLLALEEFRSLPIRYFVLQDQGIYDGMNLCVEQSLGRFVLFLNAGDLLYDDQVLENVLPRLKDSSADFLLGDHCYVEKNPNVPVYKKVRPFDETFKELRDGNLGARWFSGFPSHQSTFTRRTVFENARYSNYFKIAADHLFLLERFAQGAEVQLLDIAIAVYEGGGFSAQNSQLCSAEWHRIYHKFSKHPEKIDNFFAPTNGYRLGEHNCLSHFPVSGLYPAEGPYPDFGISLRFNWVKKEGVVVTAPPCDQARVLVVRGFNQIDDQIARCTIMDGEDSTHLSEELSKGEFSIEIRIPPSQNRTEVLLCASEFKSFGGKDDREVVFALYSVDVIEIENARFSAYQINVHSLSDGKSVELRNNFSFYGSGRFSLSRRGRIIPLETSYEFIAQGLDKGAPLYLEFYSEIETPIKLNCSSGEKTVTLDGPGATVVGLAPPQSGWLGIEKVSVVREDETLLSRANPFIRSFSQEIVKKVAVQPDCYYEASSLAPGLPPEWVMSEFEHLTCEGGFSEITFERDAISENGNYEIWLFLSAQSQTENVTTIKLSGLDGREHLIDASSKPELFGLPVEIGDDLGDFKLLMRWGNDARVLLFGIEIKTCG